ncbi:hypothetical protein V5O48_006673 [Marasmius crinis-equi]|uniref:Uncharacterized protein n=1 Tax=Marasmius crinis-equi TaxID=585013 RepID=A0ABR3FIW2_9AGAR
MFLLLLGFLALGPQVVFSDNFFRLSITQVKQCEPFAVNFKGNVNAANSSFPPESLLILPFDSVPVSIPVSPNALSATGLNLNFIPLKGNTTFFASLDDTSKLGLSLVSDVTRVFPSQTDTCLPSVPANSTPSSYELVGGVVTQCEDFTLRFNTTNPPTVRAFFPNSFSYPLKRTSASNGTATYTMQAIRGLQTVLMYDDGNGNRRTSPLMTVGGDSSTSTRCFPNFGNFNGSGGNNGQASSNSPGVSKPVVIGLSVGGTVIVLVAVAMTLFLLRERKRRMRTMATTSPEFNPPRPTNSMETSSQGHDMSEAKRRASLPLPPLPTASTLTYPEGFIKDPPYVSEKYSPTISDYPRTSIDWEDTPDGRPRTMERKSTNTRIQSIDIEKMLNLAGEAGLERNSRLPITSGSLSHRQIDDASPTLPDPRYRSQPDVPENPIFFGTSPTYAQMHGFTRDTGSIPFFESPRTMSSSVLRPSSSYDARISHGSYSPQFVLARPLNETVPNSAVTDTYMNEGRMSGRRNSIPFPITGGSSRNSRFSDASDRV